MNARSTCGLVGQGGETVRGGAEHDVDAVGDAGGLPRRSGDLDGGGVDLEAGEPAAGGQRPGHPEGRHAGERADLDDDLGVEELDEEAEEAALVLADVHARQRPEALDGVGVQLVGDRVGPRVEVGVDVVADPGAHPDRAAAAGGPGAEAAGGLLPGEPAGRRVGVGEGGEREPHGAGHRQHPGPHLVVGRHHHDAEALPGERVPMLPGERAQGPQVVGASELGPDDEVPVGAQRSQRGVDLAGRPLDAEDLGVHGAVPSIVALAVVRR